MPGTLSTRVALVMTAWFVSIVPSHEYRANSLPDIKNEDFIKDCVRIHNKFRSEVNPTASNMLFMTWDPALARIAKAWAENCRFAHNGQLHSGKLHPNFSSVGENIWTGSVSLFSVSSAITSWHSEIQDYDFETQRCTKVCGHYTQVCRRLPECQPQSPPEGPISGAMKETIRNQEKLTKLQAHMRIGRRGPVRRKKVVHKMATADDTKLQFSLKKLGVNNISGLKK